MLTLRSAMTTAPAPGCHSGCRRAVPGARERVELFQIRQGFRARWRDLRFTVESDSGQWALRVHDANKCVYQAQRSNLKAAQAAAIEFATLHASFEAGGENPNRLASVLAWTEYW